MQFPLSLLDVSLFLLTMGLILLVTSEVISPHYGKIEIAIDRKKLRKAAFLLVILFFVCAAAVIYGKIIPFI